MASTQNIETFHTADTLRTGRLTRFFRTGGDLASTAVTTPKVHAERVVTLVNQLLQLFIVANDENYALAA